MTQLIYLIHWLDLANAYMPGFREGSFLFMFGILAGLGDFSFDFVLRS
jgi:hypothetical protein